MHILKMVEWEDYDGVHCADTSDLGKGSAIWYLPARMMNMKPAEYLNWVIKNYNPDIIKHSKDCSTVWFVWKDQTTMRIYKNYINKIAREKSYLICK